MLVYYCGPLWDLWLTITEHYESLWNPHDKARLSRGYGGEDDYESLWNPHDKARLSQEDVEEKMFWDISGFH